ncbi:MAG: hypothetical protein MjAS7_2004 [Metallosphaera javensis (ex Sakai et al. 2022)]|nr:MAG: hypothetical protein MjAS7_2004 [Metallosphaera javensis (ex Sakai et al. 2022)]
MSCFKPSKDLYKLFLLFNLFIQIVRFQTLKGSLQTFNL